MLKRRLAVGAILVGISAFLMTFQNCGGGFQSGGTSPGNTVTQGSAIPLKTEPHGCFEVGTWDSQEYHQRQNPFNPGETMVYFGSYWLPSADPGSFRVLDFRHARTNQFLYYQGEVVTELLPGEQIEILGYGFLRLKIAQLIVHEDEVLHLDAASFKVHTYGTYEDKNEKVGFSERGIPSNAIALGSGYFRMDNVIYYRGNVIAGADAATFQIESDFDIPIASDSNSVYYYGEAVTLARPGNLEPMPAEISDDFGSLWNDGVNVFLYDVLLGPVGQVSHLGFGWFRVDGTIYHWDEAKPEIDATSFKIYSSEIAHDHDTFFVDGREYVFPSGFTFDSTKIRFISGAVAIIGDIYINVNRSATWTFTGDVSKVKCLSHNYFFDGAKVVRVVGGTDANDQVPGADLVQLQSYGGSDDMFTDGEKLFFRGQEIAGIQDVGTLEWINWNAIGFDGKILFIDSDGTVTLNRSVSEIIWKSDWQIGFADLFINNSEEIVTLSEINSYRMLTWGNVATPNGVIHRGQYYPGIDGTSFRQMTSELSRDANRVYYQMLPVAEIMSRPFRLIDSNGIWSLGSDLFHRNQLVSSVDASDFELISSIKQSGSFFAAQNKIFFFGPYNSQLFNEGFVEISNDRSNFTMLGSAYWKDSTRVGIGGLTIPNGIPSAARAVGTIIFDSGVNVYYGKNPAVGAVSGGDIQQYRYMIGSVSVVSQFWTDGFQVFYGGARVNQASRDTFTLPYTNNAIHWQDHNSMGFMTTAYDTTNPSSTKVYQLDGANDMVVDTGTSVYYGSTRISTAQPGSISMYKVNGTGHSCYWTDGVAVFCSGSAVTGASPATFMATGRYSGQMGAICYSHNRVTTCP